MVIVGHGIPAAVVNRLRASVIGFFNRPLDEKLTCSISKDDYRGYIPLGFFTPNAAGLSPDYYEGYKLHAETNASDPICAECELYGPNKWPDAPLDLQRNVQNYWQHCDRLSAVLLDALAQTLNIDPGIFRQAFEKPLTNMTLLHYPATLPGQPSAGIHPHKDTDALTILAPDPVGGLQLRPRGSERWVSADAPADALIVNIGDMLEVWSGGYFVSTPHKVVNKKGDERYSFPYFAVPRFDVNVTPLREIQPGFNRAAMTVGEVSRKIWQSNWPDAGAIETDYDPAIL